MHSKIVIKKNIKNVFKPHKTPENVFNNKKDKMNPLQHQRVYEIPCLGDVMYIGKTYQIIKTKHKENIANTNHNCTSNSTIVKHSNHIKYHICFNQTTILAKTQRYSTIENGVIFTKGYKPTTYSIWHF